MDDANEKLHGPGSEAFYLGAAWMALGQAADRLAARKFADEEKEARRLAREVFEMAKRLETRQ